MDAKTTKIIGGVIGGVVGLLFGAHWGKAADVAATEIIDRVDGDNDDVNALGSQDIDGNVEKAAENGGKESTH